MGNKGTYGLFDESIRNAHELLERLQRDRADIDTRIAQLQQHLADLQSEKKRAAADNGTGGKKRRKGENARAVAMVFERDPTKALTKQEIATATELPFSSVQAVLDRKDSGYTQEGGLWKRKPPTGQ